MRGQSGFTSFSMDEEFEGAQMDGNGFLSFKSERKKKARFSKEEQIYGDFLDDMDYEQQQKEEESMNFQSKAMNSLQSAFRKSGKVQHDPRKVVEVKYLNKPKQDQQFDLEKEDDNSSQQNQDSDEQDFDNEEDEDKSDSDQSDIDDDDDNDEDQEQNDGKRKKKEKKRKRKRSFDSSEDEAKEVIISKEQKRMKKIFDFSKGAQNAKNLDRDEINDKDEMIYLDLPTHFGQSKKNQQKIEQKEKTQKTKQVQIQTKKEQETQEKYGSGFSLLQKFGYKLGGGLGKKEDGINKPIEAVFKQKFTVKDNEHNSHRFKQKKTGNVKKLKIQKDSDEEDENEENEDDGGKNEEDEDGEGNKGLRNSKLSKNLEYNLQIKKKWQKSGKNDGKKQPRINKKEAFQFMLHNNNNNRRKQRNFNNNNNNEEYTSLEQNNSQNGQKIIDMTGVHTKTLDSMDQMKSQQKKNNDNYNNNNNLQVKNFLEKIQKGQNSQNVIKNMLLKAKNKFDSLNSSLSNLQHKIKHEEDKNITSEYENSQIIEEKNDKIQQQKQTDLILQSLKEIKELLSENNFSDTSMVLSTFQELFLNAKQQFVFYNLEKLFVNYYMQAFKKTLELKMRNQNNENQSISQIFDFKKLKSEFRSISQLKKLLTEIFLFQENKKISEYDNYMHDPEIHVTLHKQLQNPRPLKHSLDFIIQKGLLPTLRSYINNEYQSTNSFQLIDFFVEWKEIISKDLLEDLLKNLILPKLIQNIKSNLSDINEIMNQPEDIKRSDLWLVPWFELLDLNSMVDICKNVLQRFSLLLQKFDCKKNSAIFLLIIKPWKKQLQLLNQQPIFDSFVQRSLMPKLLFNLNSIDIDPQEQKIDDLKNIRKILSFCEIFTEDQKILLVEESIILRLGDIVQEWILQDKFEQNDIKQWLLQWKGLLGLSIMDINLFQNYFATYFRKAGIKTPEQQ